MSCGKWEKRQRPHNYPRGNNSWGALYHLPAKLSSVFRNCDCHCLGVWGRQPPGEGGNGRPAWRGWSEGEGFPPFFYCSEKKRIRAGRETWLAGINMFVYGHGYTYCFGVKDSKQDAEHFRFDVGQYYPVFVSTYYYRHGG